MQQEKIQSRKDRKENNQFYSKAVRVTRQQGANIICRDDAQDQVAVVRNLDGDIHMRWSC